MSETKSEWSSTYYLIAREKSKTKVVDSPKDYKIMQNKISNSQIEAENQLPEHPSEYATPWVGWLRGGRRNPANVETLLLKCSSTSLFCLGITFPVILH